MTETSGRGVARGTGADWLGGRNEGFGLKFQSPDEGQSVLLPKHEYGDADNSLSTVNNASNHNTHIDRYHKML